MPGGWDDRPYRARWDQRTIGDVGTASSHCPGHVLSDRVVLRVLALGLLVFSAACSSDDSASGPGTSPNEPTTTEVGAPACDEVQVTNLQADDAATVSELIRERELPDLTSLPAFEEAQITLLRTDLGVIQASFVDRLEPGAWTLTGLDSGSPEITAFWHGQGTIEQIRATLSAGAPDDAHALFDCLAPRDWFVD